MSIILAVLAALFCGAGAFCRRWWGGWEAPNHYLKLLVAVILALLVGILYFSTTKAAIAFGLIVGLGFLNPFHSYGQRMGNGGQTLFTSLAVMAGSYGVVTFLAAAAAYLLGGGLITLFFAPIGLFPAIYYALSWMVFNKFLKNADGTFKKFWHTNDKTINGVVTQEWFIDGPTAVGECALGACLIGGLPVIAALFA